MDTLLEIKNASHAIPLHCSHFIQAHKCTQPRNCCDMVESKTHEEVAHEKLVTRLARLRNAASEAVLWEDHAKLEQFAKAFTCITPTKRAIAEKGVGHLLADTNGLGQRRRCCRFLCEESLDRLERKSEAYNL